MSKTETTLHTLETERLILRKLMLADAPNIQEQANNPLLAQNMISIPYPYPDGAAEQFLREVALPDWEAGKEYIFAMIRRADDTFMGVIGIELQGNDRAEVGYWVGEVFWGNGYATEALKRVIQFGFEEMHLHRIQAMYFSFNPASRRVMDKAGMTFEGVLRDYLCKGDKYISVGVCSILRREWRT